MEKPTLPGVEEKIFDRFGIRYLSAENGRTEAELTLCEEDMNSMGTPYGGILFNLADCAAGAALYSLGIVCLTVSSEVRFMRGVRNAEKLICRAEVRKAGKTLSFVDASVEDGQGRELAAFTFIFANR